MRRIAWLTSLWLGALLLTATPARAVNTYFVDQTTDGAPGVCLPSGASTCTLREAILAANASAGADTISFNLAAGSTISPASALPPIDEAVTIDGATSGAPGIELNGTNAGSVVGLAVRASNVVIRGLVINRFSTGIVLLPTPANDVTSGITIQGNYIGTNFAGTTGMGNASAGVAIADLSRDDLIGGAAAGSGNVISANGGVGIAISDTDTAAGGAHTIRGNLIGTDAAGMVDLGNAGSGISARATTNLIEDNTISGNGHSGVALDSFQSSGNTVQGNRIGVGIDGSAPIGNGSHGILASNAAASNTVGGTAAGEPNLIAHNGGDGVLVQGGGGNRIQRNSIFGNGQLGIDLDDGTGGEVTPNDPGDADVNSNRGQNFPVLTGDTAASGGTTIHGTLNSTASTAYSIDLFSSQSCDPSGHGEGQTLLGSTTVTTDAGGNASFSTAVPFVPAGEFLTATATDGSTGDTSEFSECLLSGDPSSTSLRVKKKGNRVKVKGAVDPPHPGIPVDVTLLKKRGAGFVEVKAKSRPLSSDGEYSARFRRPSAKRCRLEASFPGDLDHLPSEASKTLSC